MYVNIRLIKKFIKVLLVKFLYWVDSLFAYILNQLKKITTQVKSYMCIHIDKSSSTLRILNRKETYRYMFALKTSFFLLFLFQCR